MRRLYHVSPVSLRRAISMNVQLGVLVLAVARQVLADGNGLLDQHVEILGNLRCEA